MTVRDQMRFQWAFIRAGMEAGGGLTRPPACGPASATPPIFPQVAGGIPHHPRD